MNRQSFWSIFFYKIQNRDNIVVNVKRNRQIIYEFLVPHYCNNKLSAKYSKQDEATDKTVCELIALLAFIFWWQNIDQIRLCDLTILDSKRIIPITITEQL